MSTVVDNVAERFVHNESQTRVDLLHTPRASRSGTSLRAKAGYLMHRVVYRFGRFVLDTGAHALVKDGTRLAIQEQPFQVLQALLENPGQVVTRESLRMRLWGTDTFVDFDQSLNSAVRRLRLVLEDNSRGPIYVETVPRIGFRFLAQIVSEGAVPAMFEGRAESPALAAGAGPRMAEKLAAPGQRRFPVRGVYAGSLALLAGLLLRVCG